MSSKKTKHTDDVRALHDQLVDAVDFVPADEGDDAERTVEVDLDDLRGLVMAAWDAEEKAREADRNARRLRGLVDELMASKQ